MKNIYSIGRDDSCDIIIHDESNVISRTHAFLRIGKRGRYTISDQSMNGTYVNGIRISTGVEVPVLRTDTISFAHISELNWSLIPDPAKKNRIVFISILGGLLLLIALGITSVLFFGRQTTLAPIPDIPETSIADSTKKEVKDTLKVIETPKPIVNKKSEETKKNNKKVEEKSLPQNKENKQEKKDTVKTEQVKSKTKIMPI